MRYQDYEIPDDLLYSKEHEWVRLEGKEAVVGITDFAQKQLHEIVYVEVKGEGSEVASGPLHIGLPEMSLSLRDRGPAHRLGTLYGLSGGLLRGLLLGFDPFQRQLASACPDEHVYSDGGDC